jgi:hypothetical protein
MLRSVPMLAMIVATALGLAQGRADDAAPTYLSQLAKADAGRDVAAPTPQPGGASLHVQGNRAAVLLDARRTTIMQVLAALTTVYGISYHSSSPLDKPVDGGYTGSLGQVITRVLEGYNFVIRKQGPRLDVSIFERSGDTAVASPMAAVIRRHRVPVTTRISRNR